jgi:ABC-type glutathione transport system ATPase component
MAANFLEVRSLTKHFAVKRGLLGRQALGYVKAVDGVDFAINQGETFGLVGESGCGTTVANAILLLHTPTSGEILFPGAALKRLWPGQLKTYRRAVQAVFQDPYGALNPRLRAGEIVEEPLLAHGYSRADRQARVREALWSVGLPHDSGVSFTPRQWIPTVPTRRPLRLRGRKAEGGRIARSGALTPFLVNTRGRHAPQKVELVRDVHQRSRLDLGMALGDPGSQAPRL